MKNGVECYKDFFGYFNALKTNCELSSKLSEVTQKLSIELSAELSKNCPKIVLKIAQLDSSRGIVKETQHFCTTYPIHSLIL
jgi:hypothetical protein